MLVFEERGKLEYPEKNLSEQGRKPTTNSSQIWRRVQESNPGHLGVKRGLSPLTTALSLLSFVEGARKIEKGRNVASDSFNYNLSKNIKQTAIMNITRQYML